MGRVTAPKTERTWENQTLRQVAMPRTCSCCSWLCFCMALSSRPSSAAANICADTRCRSTSMSLVLLKARSKRPSSAEAKRFAARRLRTASKSWSFDKTRSKRPSWRSATCHPNSKKSICLILDIISYYIWWCSCGFEHDHIHEVATKIAWQSQLKEQFHFANYNLLQAPRGPEKPSSAAANSLAAVCWRTLSRRSKLGKAWSQTESDWDILLQIVWAFWAKNMWMNVNYVSCFVAPWRKKNNWAHESCPFRSAPSRISRPVGSKLFPNDHPGLLSPAAAPPAVLASHQTCMPGRLSSIDPTDPNGMLILLCTLALVYMQWLPDIGSIQTESLRLTSKQQFQT